MIQAWRPIAYSLIKRQEGSNSGLSACKPIMTSATAAAPAAAIRDGMTLDELVMTNSDEALILFSLPPLREPAFHRRWSPLPSLSI